jgi:antirestriction protein
MMATPTNATPRIYVACMAAYNNGKLHGEWIDANQDVEDLQEAIAKVLSTSPEPGAEEWAVHAYDNMPPGMGECPDLEEISEYARLFDEYGEAFAVFADHEGLEYATEERFQDTYLGEYDSLVAYAEEYAENYMEIPDIFAHYIDYEAIALDLDCAGYRERKGHIFCPI